MLTALRPTPIAAPLQAVDEANVEREGTDISRRSPAPGRTGSCTSPLCTGQARCSYAAQFTSRVPPVLPTLRQAGRSAVRHVRSPRKCFDFECISLSLSFSASSAAHASAYPAHAHARCVSTKCTSRTRTQSSSIIASAACT